MRLHLDGELLSAEANGETLVLDDRDVTAASRGLAVWVNPTNRIALAVAQLSQVLYLCDLDRQHAEPEHLFRDEEPDLRFVVIEPLSDGSLLILYERGLLRLGTRGTVIWHGLHDDLSARIAAITAAEVVLETQWPEERSGSRRRYRLEDGVEPGDG